KLADLMRRLGFCEEKGSGLDKVIFNNELYQLPPINVIVAENRTRVTMYSYKTLNDLDKKEKIRACYQHACLKYVSNEKMTNQSLRDRFKIESHNYSIASRIIKDALEAGVIKDDDPESRSRKYASYIPFWA
ncbi:MAG TPA: transcriptional regulator, partial [Ferruginibacter sp.]|nr:transcriptional regulator [Ferruginibacter sp.]